MYRIESKIEIIYICYFYSCLFTLVYECCILVCNFKIHTKIFVLLIY